MVDTSNANWLDATVAANFPIRKRPKIPNNSIFIPAQRRMGRADEALNPEIARYRNTHQQRLAPTEQDFYFGPTHRHLIENGFATALDTIVRETLDVLDETDRSKDDDLLPYIAFFKDREDLVDEDHVVHGVGAAGLLLACKLRMAGIITQGNWFDSSLEAPQVVIAPPTEMPLANNEDELRDPTKLSPYSALSTLARAGRWMIKAGISSL